MRVDPPFNQPGGPIRWCLHLPVARERVFDALATDNGRERFWALRSAQHGAVIDFEFKSGVRTRAVVIECTSPTRFVLDYFGARTCFDLRDDGVGGTELTLTCSGVAPHDWHEVHAGWLNVLLPLKAWLMAGLDLRNPDPARDWRAGYADS